DALILAINAETLRRWAAHLEACLDRAGNARIAALIDGYFDFAEANPNLWGALYEHRLDGEMPEWYRAELAQLLAIVGREVRVAAPDLEIEDADRLAASLLAMVHGHAAYALDGTFARIGIADPRAIALARAEDVLTQISGRTSVARPDK
ncbi:MAG: TetR-like C-terminal domain-containing protein, partial [Pseudomonadota bacterium]